MSSIGSALDPGISQVGTWILSRIESVSSFSWRSDPSNIHRDPQWPVSTATIKMCGYKYKNFLATLLGAKHPPRSTHILNLLTIFVWISKQTKFLTFIVRLKIKSCFHTFYLFFLNFSAFFPLFFFSACFLLFFLFLFPLLLRFFLSFFAFLFLCLFLYFFIDVW